MASSDILGGYVGGKIQVRSNMMVKKKNTKVVTKPLKKIEATAKPRKRKTYICRHCHGDFKDDRNIRDHYDEFPDHRKPKKKEHRKYRPGSEEWGEKRGGQFTPGGPGGPGRPKGLKDRYTAAREQQKILWRSLTMDPKNPEKPPELVLYEHFQKDPGLKSTLLAVITGTLTDRMTPDVNLPNNQGKGDGGNTYIMVQPGMQIPGGVPTDVKQIEAKPVEDVEPTDAVDTEWDNYGEDKDQSDC